MSMDMLTVRTIDPACMICCRRCGSFGARLSLAGDDPLRVVCVHCARRVASFSTMASIRQRELDHTIVDNGVTGGGVDTKRGVCD